VSRAVVARAPTRLDFGGGWTDVPPYAENEGGAVCNVAINRYATATVALGASASPTSMEPLVRAALRHAGMPAATASVASDFPVGAGLGGSSAAGVALAGALAALRGTPLECAELAELSHRTEVDELGIAGGFQDHYAAAFGGALLLTFEGCVGVERLTLSHDTSEGLARRGLLVYTGESRISASTITAVVDACRAGDPRVCGALARMKSLARDMAAALRAADLDALGAMVGEHWIHQRALHPSITTKRIDAIMEAAGRAGALGAKALGASGGGCVLAIAREGREDELARALDPLGERLDFTVDHIGFDVVAVMENRDANGTDEASA
jgi:D-glycero-alpha-D-manno-heptose-7-phosphate kinase